MLLRGDGKIFKRDCKSYTNYKKGRVSKDKSSTAPRPIVNKEVLYEVENVIKSKIDEYGRQYFVKWTGYGPMYNSWIWDLPPFFEKGNPLYKKNIPNDDSETSEEDGSDSQYVMDSDEGSGEGSDEGSEEGSDEGSEEGSDEGSEEGSEDGSEKDAMHGSSFKVYKSVHESKKQKKTTGDTSSYNDKDTFKSRPSSEKKKRNPKMVAKALLALSAVVAECYVDNTESDSDE